MRIYVAGPMRGIPLFNFPAFDEAARRLTDLGHHVFNPAAADRATHGDDFGANNVTGDESIEPAFNLRHALGSDLAWITAHADAVAVLPGWEHSKGAQAEVATAFALGLTVAYAGSFTAKDGVFYDRPITEMPTESNPSDEVRTTSSTGGQKGVKLARFDLIPPGPLTELAEHYGRGAQKYDDNQWRRGYEWSKSFGAMQRHAWQWYGGEDTDAETGSNHLVAVAWHAFTLLQFAADHPQHDNRPHRYGAAS